MKNKVTPVILILLIMFMLIVICSCGKGEKFLFIFENDTDITMSNGYKYSRIPVSKVWMVDYDEKKRIRYVGNSLYVDENGFEYESGPGFYQLYRNDTELLVLTFSAWRVGWMPYYSTDYDYPELSADVVDAVGFFKGRRDRILMDEDIVNSVFEIMSREELTFEDVGFTTNLQVISLYEYDSGIPLKSVCSFEEKEGKYYFRCRRDDPSSESGFVNIYYETTEEEMDQIVNTVLKKGKAVRYPSMLSK